MNPKSQVPISPALPVVLSSTSAPKHRTKGSTLVESTNPRYLCQPPLADSQTPSRQPNLCPPAPSTFCHFPSPTLPAPTIPMTILWANPAISDAFDTYLHDPSMEFKAVIAQIPSLFGLSKKATYLAFRAMGLPTEETLLAMEMSEETLAYWRDIDPDFLTFEAQHLADIQSQVAPRLIQSGFLSNMALLVAKDAQIIRKSLSNLEDLSNREFKYLSDVRKHYTPSDMLALDKALNPTNHREEVSLVLTWGGETQSLTGVDRQEAYMLTEGDYHDVDQESARRPGNVPGPLHSLSEDS